MAYRSVHVSCVKPMAAWLFGSRFGGRARCVSPRENNYKRITILYVYIQFSLVTYGRHFAKAIHCILHFTGTPQYMHFAHDQLHLLSACERVSRVRVGRFRLISERSPSGIGTECEGTSISVGFGYAFFLVCKPRGSVSLDRLPWVLSHCTLTLEKVSWRPSFRSET